MSQRSLTCSKTPCVCLCACVHFPHKTQGLRGVGRLKKCRNWAQVGLCRGQESPTSAKMAEGAAKVAREKAHDAAYPGPSLREEGLGGTIPWRKVFALRAQGAGPVYILSNSHALRACLLTLPQPQTTNSSQSHQTTPPLLTPMCTIGAASIDPPE
jgi:hypothetical protein